MRGGVNEKLWKRTSVCELNHRLRGSASPVLTATHHSYGIWQSSTRTEK